MESRIRPLLLSLALSVAAAGAHAAPPDAGAPADLALQALYWEGHDALQHADWTLALERFRTLEQQLREEEPQATDAAVYWQAYALAQAGRSVEARAEIDRLQREFPDSRWQADATALLRGSAVTAAPAAAAAAGADAELAEAAIEGLLHAPAERALPILQRVLASDHPDKVKERALFVLGQLDSEAALAALKDVASSGSPALQREAVQMLGISGSPGALEALQSVYSAQPALRKRVLHAWMVAGADQQVVEAARNEADPELRREAVQMLGVMGADAALEALYADSRDAGVREAIVRAWGVSGAAEQLERVARSDADAGVRRDALHALGVAGAGDALQRLYRDSTDPELREDALQGLLVTGDSERVLEIYRNARSAQEKKEALRILTLMGDDTAIEAIEEALR